MTSPIITMIKKIMPSKPSSLVTIIKIYLLNTHTMQNLSSKKKKKDSVLMVMGPFWSRSINFQNATNKIVYIVNITADNPQ